MAIALVDNSNLVNISFAKACSILAKKKGTPELTDEEFPFIWHMYAKKVLPYLAGYSHLVFCGEGFNSTLWRKKIYPAYKENRKAAKENDNYKYLLRLYKETEEFLNLFQTKNIRVENCEADDCIYAIASLLAEQNEEVHIISNDKDLSQIMNFYDGVIQVNPIDGSLVPKNENIILYKTLVGDSSDNISGLAGFGEKTWEKFLETKDRMLIQKKMKPGSKELLEAIDSIVDLRKFPKEYQENIKKIYNETPWNTFDDNKVEEFLKAHSLNSICNEWKTHYAYDVKVAIGTAESILPEDDGLDELMSIINS